MTVEQRALSNSYATWLLVAVSTLAAVYRWLNIGSRPRRAAPQAQHHVAPAGAAPEGVITDVGVLTAVTQDGLLAKEVGPSITEVVVTHPQPQLGYFPPTLTSWPNLTTIDLTGNRIIYIPATIANLQQLKVLKLAHNQLNSFTAELGCLTGLEQLDASHNQLTRLPPTFTQLKGLQALNLMGNPLEELPRDFGALTSLVRLGLKGCGLRCLPPSFSRLGRLVELFITDNALTSLPEGFGSLSQLVKLQASFNPLTSLPADFYQLPALELARFAVSDFAAWPQDLLQTGGLPRLAWCSLGGAPAVPAVPAVPEDLPLVEGVEGLGLGPKLGDGASGEVFTGTYCGQRVAVKLFRGDVSPDGRTAEEVGMACAVSHPHLPRVRARLGSREATQGLVLDYVEGAPLAAKPTSQHLLRCKWAPDTSFTPAALLSIASGVASALAYLHGCGVCHGDVYAHNVLVDGDAHATLVDFGASYCYPPEQAGWWQAMEVRGFGLLLADLVQRLEVPPPPQQQQQQQQEQQQQQQEADVAQLATGTLRQKLQALVEACCQPVPSARPSFGVVLEQLQELQR